MKNIAAKAEELVEEKKNAATSLLEKQVRLSRYNVNVTVQS